MEKNKNFAFGFSVAELLITMLISAVIAAAMVPVIGLKKVKLPRNLHNHGIAECYYKPTGFDGNGDATGWDLYYYYVDNGTKKDSHPVKQPGNSCTFTVPTADFYEITAVGAGTDGYNMTPEFRVEIGGGAGRTGTIRVDSQFNSDIANAEVEISSTEKQKIGPKLLQLIDEWSKSDKASELYAEYTLKSPVGAGGDGGCKVVTRTFYGCYCTEDLADESCGECGGRYYTGEAELFGGPGCWYLLYGRGQNSGKGGKISNKIRVPLTADTQIQTTASLAQTVLRIVQGGSVVKEIKLLASAKGAAPVSLDNHKFDDIYPSEFAQAASCTGTDCGSFAIDDTLFNHGAVKDPAGRSCSSYGRRGEQADPGEIYFGEYEVDKDPVKLKWDYAAAQVRPTYGSAGETGKEVTMVYENLEGTLTLHPARDKNDYSYAHVSNNPSSVLVSAQSGTNDGTKQTDTFTMVQSDMPIPSIPLKKGKVNNKDVFGYAQKVTALKYNEGLKECIEKNWCPGYAGNGQYMYITSLPNEAALTLTNLYNNAPYSIPIEAIKKEKDYDDSNPICDDRVTVPKGSGMGRYCKEPKSKGSPGAVIIMW